MLQGRLSKKWAISQHFFIQQSHSSADVPQGTYEIWKKSFIPTLIQYGLDLWDLWNKVVHGSNPWEMAEIKCLKLNKKITIKYNMGETSVSYAQRRLFQKTEILRLQDSNHSKQNWLTSVNIAQQARKLQLELIQALASRLTCFPGFTITIVPKSPRRHKQRSSLSPSRQTKGIQKTLRELFLNSQPSVRYQTEETVLQPQTS